MGLLGIRVAVAVDRGRSDLRVGVLCLVSVAGTNGIDDFDGLRRDLGADPIAGQHPYLEFHHVRRILFYSVLFFSNSSTRPRWLTR